MKQEVLNHSAVVAGVSFALSAFVGTQQLRGRSEAFTEAAAAVGATRLTFSVQKHVSLKLTATT